MDTFQTIASKRDMRSYADEPVSEDVLERVLEAGRLTGNAKNRQQRRFVILSEAARGTAATAVTRASNLERCTAAIAIVSGDAQWADFDAGRAAQSMMLAAWSEGVGSCPNAIADREVISELLGLQEGEKASILLSFGYPPGHHTPGSRTVEEWLARADRAPLSELVTRI